MRELQLVGVTDDGAHLLLRRSDGEETPMLLPVDERLHAALRGDRARLGQLQIQLDTQVRPRDIQARIRSGESVESVAASAAIPLDRVLRYAGPVIAEREYVAGRARQATVRRSGGDGPAPILQDAVSRWASDFQVDSDLIRWDAWKRDDGRWHVSASWAKDTRALSALFSFDPAGRSVVPADEQARAVAGEPPPPQPVPPPETVPPGRLSVVAAAVPDEPDEPEEPDELTEYLAATDAMAVLADETFHDPDDEPTGPIPVGGRRPRRGERRRPYGSSRPADEATGERLRLTDIANRVELEVDSDPPVDTARPANLPEPPVNPSAHVARPVSSGARSRRPAVPSWDEIMFGRRRKPD